MKRVSLVGFGLAVSGYFTKGSGFWFSAVYYSCGLFLINGERSRPLGTDLEQLIHAFHQGVNVTLGLPFVRTSPDHGTAFEIAGKNIPRPDSMIAALNLAVELTRKTES